MIMVTTYHNHPSYIMWANGNEGGFNKAVDEVYSLIDLQDRPVIHPWALFDGVDAMHYPRFDHLTKALKRPFVLLPTELLHGLYDGGHGAGLADYWSLIERSKVGAGGVLWCWADAGVARTDQDGRIDTAGNYSADGIVGPRREKEASYFTIREIWSPIQIPLEALPSDFDGTLPLENDYYFSTFEGAHLEWKLMTVFQIWARAEKLQVTAEGKVPLPAVAPQAKGSQVKLPLSKDWKQNDVLVVKADQWRSADAVVLAAAERCAWRWPPRKSGIEQTGPMRFKCRGSVGPLIRQPVDCFVVLDGKETGLGNGPVLYAGTEKGAISNEGAWQVDVERKNETVVLVSSQAEGGSSFSWTLYPDGQAAAGLCVCSPGGGADLLRGRF
jgi:hypothetical protein